MFVCFLILRPKIRRSTTFSKKPSLLSMIIQYGLLFFILFLINRRSITSIRDEIAASAQQTMDEVS
jgi:hypothetical protein